MERQREVQHLGLGTKGRGGRRAA